MNDSSRPPSRPVPKDCSEHFVRDWTEAIKSIDLSNNDNMESREVMIATSLRMRANYIETGDVCLSRNDAIAMKNSKIVKGTTPQQEQLILELRRLADQLDRVT